MRQSLKFGMGDFLLQHVSESLKSGHFESYWRFTFGFNPTIQWGFRKGSNHLQLEQLLGYLYKKWRLLLKTSSRTDLHQLVDDFGDRQVVSLDHQILDALHDEGRGVLHKFAAMTKAKNN